MNNRAGEAIVSKTRAPLPSGRGAGGEGIWAWRPNDTSLHELSASIRPAEDILWQRLRGSRFHDAKFRRQVPFDRYVVDFYCHAAKLVVEIDGRQHGWFAGYDEGRTEVLSRLGVNVIRIGNAEVCDNLDAALARVHEAMGLPIC